MSYDHPPNSAVPFNEGQWLVDIADPSRRGQYIGKSFRAGPQLMLQVRYPDGTVKSRPLQSLLVAEERGTAEQQFAAGRYGRITDLRRLITFEKLRGTLHEVIYSMEAAQVDFYPYQFKPVLKFIDSPTERLLIADEVGLGKTIESLLIWMELVARRQAKRLLIVCPKLLTEKWRTELRTKFQIDASIVGHQELNRAVQELRERGPGFGCVLITSYSALRPPKGEVASLDRPDVDPETLSPKTRLLHQLRHWDREFVPFDLVVFDEAHYMRNSSTASFRLGESLASLSAADGVLCVSATPVNNRNTDLHSLLRLVDPDFFQTQGTFDALLEANQPTVRAANALARHPPDMAGLAAGLQGMRESAYIGESPLLAEVESLFDGIAAGDDAAVARGQALLEKLNLLGAYVTRTRRTQVKENRPLREPQALLVTYSREERRLYDAILQLVRRKCEADRRPFHVFHVMGLQLRAASCLPAIASEIRAGRLGEPGEILAEAFGEVVIDEVDGMEAEGEEDLDTMSASSLLDYDFEGNDSKYRELRRLLLEQIPDEKAVLFSYYHATLRYLRRRLSDDGVPVAMIHGHMPQEERLEEIGRVKESSGRMVLLSSEVGSEGLDMQFCRVVINYDLPWNPMRVEQRIGRIDRVGQEAKKLIVVNFKVVDTIEERLYDKLHAKLLTFANSLGDLEEVIGRQVQELTVALLSRDLTPDQERHLLEQTRGVIEKRLIEMQVLEEKGDALLSLSDYVQRKLEEDRGRGRFVQPEELEEYLRDFFEREFQGCEFLVESPAPGCLTLRLSNDAAQSLSSFVGDDQSLSAQPFRRREFSLSFRREAVMALPPEIRRRVAFANHMSPLVRWVTKRNAERPEGFHPVAAVDVASVELPSGAYVYRIERWRFKGTGSREQLAYGAIALESATELEPDKAELLVQQVLRNGLSWQYPDAAAGAIRDAHSALDAALIDRFGSGITAFDNENETAHRIRTERVNSVFARRIAFDEQRLRSAVEGRAGDRVLKMMEGRLRTAREARDARIAELAAGATTDYERETVAVGIARVRAGVPLT
jgi:superfamily II DNA or RNA helicase